MSKKSKKQKEKEQRAMYEENMADIESGEIFSPDDIEESQNEYRRNRGNKKDSEKKNRSNPDEYQDDDIE